MRIFQFLVLTTNYMYHSKLQERMHLRVQLSGQPCDLFRPGPEFDFLCARLSPPWCLTCSLGLQDVQWAVRNSRGARKLAQTPHANKKKKKDLFVTQLNNFNIYSCNIELNLLSLLSKEFIIYHSFYIFLICTH